MKPTLFIRVTKYVVTFLAVFSVLSCVQEKYEISEDNLNLEVTVFQEGVQIPLGNTDSLKIKDLLETFGQDESAEYLEYIKTIGPDGVYAFSMQESQDLSESLAELKDIQNQIQIDAMTIDEEISFNLSSVDVSDFKVEGQKYNMDYDLGELIGDFKVEVPDLAPVQVQLKANLGDYIPDLSEFDFGLDKEPFEEGVEIGQLAGIENLPSGFAALVGNDVYKAPILIDPAQGMEYIHPLTGETLLSLSPMCVDLEAEPYTMQMTMDLPEGLTSIDNIVLKDGASVTVTVAIENSLFTDGHILPHIDFDVHEIFHLTDEENSGHDALTIDHIVDDFDLKATGANISKSYKVKSINVSKDDIKDGKLQINRTISLSDKTALNYTGLTTSLQKLVETDGKPMHIYLSLAFENFEVDYVDLTVDQDEPVVVETKEEIPVKLDFAVPADVIESIGYAQFAATMPEYGQKKGNVHLALSVENVKDFMTLGLESLEITFPEELVVEGAVNGKLTYQVTDLVRGLDEYINIKEIRLPEPQDGKISIDKNITVTAKASASVSGSVNSAELAESEDVIVNLTVESDLEFKDYEVAVKGFDYEVNEVYAIEEKLPEEMQDFKGSITIYLKDSPEIRIGVVCPPIDVPVVAGEGGLKICLPELLKFDEADLAEFGTKYDGDRTLTFAEGDEIPTEIVLGIEHIVVSPVSREDGMYVTGSFEVSGNIGVKEGQKVHKADIDVLTGNDAEAKNVKINIEIPDLVPDNVAVDTYSAEITEEVEFDLLAPEDIPEMIVSVGEVELNDVYIDFAVDASELLSILGGAELSFNCEVKVPDYIVIEGVGVIEDKDNECIIIPLEAKADSDGMIRMNPIKVKAIDLTGVIEAGKGLKGVVAVSGSATLTDASIDVDDLQESQELSISLNGGIRGNGENGAIVITKVAAKVDYQLDPITQSIDLSGFSEALEVEGLSVDFALSHVHLCLDIMTNLGISADADVSLVPYYDGEAAEPINCHLDIDAPETAGEVKHTKYWLGDKAECAAEGYTFKKLPIVDLFRNIPDSIQVNFIAGTDKDKLCMLDTQADYTLTVDYSIEVPFQFDEEFDIEFTYTVSELPEILGTIFQYGSLALTGEVTSGLPLNLNMTAELLDENGRVIPLDEKAGKLNINACEGLGKPSVTEVNLLFAKKKDTVMPDISALRLTFNADAVNVPVTEDSFLILELQALVPEGVTVDLKEFMSNE